MNAFPNVHDPKTGTMSHGMSLRDYFAAKAMQVIDDAESMEQLAMLSYAMADAMMKAREE
jgi:hypothetical protein